MMDNVTEDNPSSENELKTSEIASPTPNSAASVIVKVEKSDSNLQQQAQQPAVVKKQSLYSRCTLQVGKIAYYFLLCLLCVCLAPFAYAFATIGAVALLVLLSVSLFVLRMLQFICKGLRYGKGPRFKFRIRSWMLVVAVLLLLELALFIPIANYVPRVKHATIANLSIIEWMRIVCMMIGIYIISYIFCFLLYRVLSRLSRKFQDRDKYITDATTEVIDCLFVWWAEIVIKNHVSAFKQHKLLGLYTRRWIEVSIFALIGYNVVKASTNLIVWSIRAHCGKKYYNGRNCIKSWLHSAVNELLNRRYVVYYAIGIRRSIDFILNSTMLLCTWVFFIGSRINTTPQAHGDSIRRFGTMTCVSLLICSIFWLIKTWMLLYWEAHVVYYRLDSKIRDIGKLLYLVAMSDRRIAKPPHHHPQPVYWLFPTVDVSYKWLRRKAVRDELIIQKNEFLNLYRLHKAAQYFVEAKATWLTETYVSDCSAILENLKWRSQPVIYEVIKEGLDELFRGEDYSADDWSMFEELVANVDPSKQMSVEKIETWRERAYSRCVYLANTLSSANEVVGCLNKVVSMILIGVTLVMWLLLTGLATTKVLVLIASPLLAATFIFGDTCKSLFQGIIFVYAVHPFDVGDICIVDDKLMEVKSIGVWRTIFSRVRAGGSHEEVIYPNLDLANKNIINNKTEFNWSDHVEFNVDSLDQQNLKILRNQIENYLDQEKEKFTRNCHSVVVMEIGDSIKMDVHFKHNMSTKDWTYYECLKEKDRLRSEFALHLQDLVNKQKRGPKAPENLVEETPTAEGNVQNSSDSTDEIHEG